MNTEEIKEYLINNEIDTQSAHAALMVIDFVFRAYSDSEKITGVRHDHIYCYFESGNADVLHQFIGKDNLRKVSKKLYADYHKNPASLVGKMKAHQDLSQNIDKLWAEYVARSRDGISDEILLEYFSKITVPFYEWWKYGVIGEDKAEVINWEIVSRFQKRHDIGVEEASEAISVLAHPDEPAIFNQERNAFFKICLAICQKENTQGLIESYIKNFFWIKTNFYTAGIVDAKTVIADAMNEISLKSEDGIKKELLENDANFTDIQARKAEVLNSYELTDDDLADIEFSKAVILWFDQRKIGMMKDFHYLLSILREIAAHKKIDYDICALYFAEDIIALLEKDAYLDQEILTARENNLFVAFEDGKRSIYSGNEAHELYDIVMKKNHPTKLKGVVASRGGKEKIRGIVNIVIRPDKNDFEEGKILVTSMTRIEFVPLMKKALAIITNEGGLACHAAIVSRELGIPAIIGTKSATKVLRNGDEIEMDMKTGEIKII